MSYCRRLSEESDSDFKDSSSEGSSSESERGLSLRKEHLEDSSSDDGQPLSSQGRLIFEYLERDLPYIREPFADKVFLCFNSVYQVSNACVQVN